MYEACRLWESCKEYSKKYREEKALILSWAAFTHSAQLMAEQMTLINDSACLIGA